MDGFLNPIVGGISLRIPAIRSPDYVAAVSGWTINVDGSAEFNNGTFRGTVTASTFQGTDFVINSSGEFYYSSTPAAGNLVGSVSPIAGTDGFGNQYPAGFTTYDRSALTFTNTNGGQVSFGQLVAGQPDTANQGVLLGAGGVPQLALISRVEAGFPDAAELVINSGASGQPVGGATAPSILIDDMLGTSKVRLVVNGALEYQSGSGVTPGWQTPSYNTGWAGGSTASASYQTLLYRITGENELWLYGAAHATAGAPSTTVLTTIAGYRPVPLGGVGTASIFPGGTLIQTSSTDVIKATGRFNVSSGGAVQLGGFTIANTDNFYFDHKIPLGDLS